MAAVGMIICIIVFFLVALSVIRAPKIKIPDNLKYLEIDFSVAPILGVFLLLLTQTLNWNDVVFGIVGNDQIKPWQIIILFFSLAYVCVSLDSSGIYNYFALKAVLLAKGNGRLMFLAFFILSSVLTIFTSNDIVILTLTPIIAYFCDYTKSDPLPYLFAQFFACNIWSISLEIGNPTNIIVAEAFNIPFLEYSLWMFLPAVVSGLTSLGMVYLVFRSRIPETMNIPKVDPSSGLEKVYAIYGLVCLFGCLFLLSLSGKLNIDIWIITLGTAALMLIKDIVSDYRSFGFQRKFNLLQDDNERNIPLENAQIESFVNEKDDAEHDENLLQPHDNPQKVKHGWKDGNTVTTLVRLPWKIVPFVVGMFIMVQGLNTTGLIAIFATGMASNSMPYQVGLSAIVGNYVSAIFVMCYLSALVCNLINNQPMTILFTNILLHENFEVSAITQQASMYALIMGSNFGANFTLIGALAGIMWSSILSDKRM